MIISSEAAERRLNSSHNLMNHLREIKNENGRSAMSLFGLGGNNKIKDPVPVLSFNPFLKPDILSSKSTDLTPVKSSVANEPSLELDSSPIPNVIKLDDILDSAESKIKLELAHNEALDTLVDSVKAIRSRIGTEEKPAKLADIAAKMSRIVDSIRRERSDSSKSEAQRQVHYHFYTPIQKKVEEYEVIEVS